MYNDVNLSDAANAHCPPTKASVLCLLLYSIQSTICRSLDCPVGSPLGEGNLNVAQSVF